MSGSDSLDDTNSAKITLDEEVDGVKMRSSDQELVAIGPGLPCGYTTKQVPICEEGTANMYTMLVQEGTTAATDDSVPCSISSDSGSGSVSCCTPTYTSLGFYTTVSVGMSSVSLMWNCLKWDGAKYQGLNNVTSSVAGSYSLSVLFDECGRGWTGVVEPLNTQSILGTLSTNNMASLGAAVGSYTFTGGGPVLFSDEADEISVDDHKADDLDGCDDDLLDSSIFPTSSTELINTNNSLVISECITTEEGCDCAEINDSQYEAASPIQLYLYPDEMDTSTYIDLGNFQWIGVDGLDSDGAEAFQGPCTWIPEDPSTSSMQGYMAVANDGSGTEYWTFNDHGTYAWSYDGSSGNEGGYINAMNWDNGGGGTWNYAAGEIYSSQEECIPGMTDSYTSGFTLYSVDTSGVDALVDPYNSGSASNRAKIEVQ